jgi:hypothetical protein
MMGCLKMAMPSSGVSFLLLEAQCHGRSVQYSAACISPSLESGGSADGSLSLEAGGSDGSQHAPIGQCFLHGQHHAPQPLVPC